MKRNLYKFNWTDLYRHSDNDINSILILTYCLTIGYNKTIGWTPEELRNKLSINNIPQNLFTKKLLITNKWNGIKSRYKCNLPQSYFKNPYFLTYNCDPNIKVGYIYILSHRRMTENSNFLPDYYVDSKIWENNPLIKHKDGNIYFMPEVAYHRQRTQFEKEKK